MTQNFLPLHSSIVHDNSCCLSVRHLSKVYPTILGPKHVLNDITFDVSVGEKIAVLGRNGSGKSTLVRIIAGVEEPTQGSILRRFSMSWPLGFSGGFDNEMSGLDAVRFISRLYNVEFGNAKAVVEEFSELGHYMKLPIGSYSTGMRSRLAFGLSLSVDFDCYLIDEVISVGDQRFRQKCHDELFVKRANKAMILVSHDIHTIREYCNKALVLKRGRGRIFSDLEMAISIYATL